MPKPTLRNGILSVWTSVSRKLPAAVRESALPGDPPTAVTASWGNRKAKDRSRHLALTSRGLLLCLTAAGVKRRSIYRRRLTFDQLVCPTLSKKPSGLSVRPRLDDLAPVSCPATRPGNLFCVVDFSAIASESSSIQGKPFYPTAARSSAFSPVSSPGSPIAVLTKVDE